MARLHAGRRYAYTWPEYNAKGTNGPVHVPAKTITYTVNRIEGRRAYITWENGANDFFTIKCPIALGSRELED